MMDASEGLCPGASDRALTLIRVMTCGSVDDGKSTLIGRILHDSGQIDADHFEGLTKDSVRYGAADGEIDLSLLLDGLESEREQAITIDIAFRHLTYKGKRILFADCPGHEQYTRNMVTGASTADVAILLVDARLGMVRQTKRHIFIASLLGVRKLVVAVNKMDAVSYAQSEFLRIERSCAEAARNLGVTSLYCVPISAKEGDNVVRQSPRMPWFGGSPLLPYLHSIELDATESERGFRMPIQWVNRPSQDFRGFCGTLTSGRIGVGDEALSLPSGTEFRIQKIYGAKGEAVFAEAGEAVTVVLDRDVDLGRGDVICPSIGRAEVSDQFAVHLIWLGKKELSLGSTYDMTLGTRTVLLRVLEIKHRIDVETLVEVPCKSLITNEIAYCIVSLSEFVCFEEYSTCRKLGGFIVVDRHTRQTVGVGMIRSALPKQSLIGEVEDIGKVEREFIKGQVSRVLWFTGISGAGKSTVAGMVERDLHALGRHTMLLDGDRIREGLSRDLEFTDEDRVENVRRVAELSKLMTEAGLIVLVSMISPFDADRKRARALFDDGVFVEIHVDTTVEEAGRRDSKGLYGRARSGMIQNFTGVSSLYEPPVRPDVHLDADKWSARELSDQLMKYLRDIRI